MVTLPKIGLVLYGLLLLFMGIQSYFFPTGDPSLVSLIAAGGTGVLVIIAFFVSLKKPRIGYIIGLIVALLTLGRFLPVYFENQSPYPELTAVIASALLIAVLVGGHLAAMAAKKKGAPEADGS